MTQKIAIYAPDSKMPNYAIMKVSAYHKEQGDTVEWYTDLWAHTFDKVYCSKIFNYTPMPNMLNDNCVYGGTGYDIKKQLPQEIEDCDLDYSIYPNCDYSLMMFSRGCIRKCPFCIVSEKEGVIRPIDSVSLNPKGKRIEILDNNFFANPNWEKAVKALFVWNQPVNFHGIDARILTEKQTKVLDELRHFKHIHIAWDNPKEDLLPKLKKIIQWINPKKLMCYVLIGYWSTKEEDMYRIVKLRELDIDPFVMPYNKSDPYQKRIARWVNHKAIFESVKWEDYDPIKAKE